MFAKKIAKRFKLLGITAEGCVANTRQANDVVCFVTQDRKIKIRKQPIESSLHRHDGRRGGSRKNDIVLVEGPDLHDIPFEKHAKYQFYKGQIGNREVNIVLKKTSGELRVIEYVPLPTHVIDRLVDNGYYCNYE